MRRRRRKFRCLRICHQGSVSRSRFATDFKFHLFSHGTTVSFPNCFRFHLRLRIEMSHGPVAFYGAPLSFGWYFTCYNSSFEQNEILEGKTAQVLCFPGCIRKQRSFFQNGVYCKEKNFSLRSKFFTFKS